MERMETSYSEEEVIRLADLIPESLKDQQVDTHGTRLPMVRKVLRPSLQTEDDDEEILEPHPQPHDNTGHFVGRGGGMTSTGVGQRSQGAGDIGGKSSGRTSGKGAARMGHTTNMEPGADTDQTKLKGSGKEPSVSNITV